MYMYIYIYIYIERERDTYMLSVYIYIYIYTHVYTSFRTMLSREVALRGLAYAPTGYSAEEVQWEGNAADGGSII